MERNTIHRGGIKTALITRAQEGINFMREMAEQRRAKKESITLNTKKIRKTLILVGEKKKQYNQPGNHHRYR